MTTKDLILQKLDLAPESLLDEILHLLETHTPLNLPFEPSQRHDGKALIEIAGSLSDIDTQEMTEAIADCRQVDLNEW